MTDRPIALKNSENVFADVRSFFVHRPRIATLVDTATPEARSDLTLATLQRIGVDVSDFSVLNVHRIGIDAPASLVFEEVLAWDGESPCWPNHVATVQRIGGKREHVSIVLLGRPSANRVARASDLASPRMLFHMRVVKLRRVPAESDADNARYLLWECRGGYPIGIFLVYVRSGLAELGESEATQVFFAVGFNPHGRKFLSKIQPVRRTWEIVHNRVTANVLNRFKIQCEIHFGELRAGTTNEPEERDFHEGSNRAAVR